ncbi:MAG: hypothetical protein D6773_18045 [Alphaproteobacteria bacterium]|nr:MAG: hypothetical protein D6773_18045 [Alphaproteobacteria bacterium]
MKVIFSPAERSQHRATLTQQARRTAAALLRPFLPLLVRIARALLPAQTYTRLREKARHMLGVPTTGPGGDT